MSGLTALVARCERVIGLLARVGAECTHRTVPRPSLRAEGGLYAGALAGVVSGLYHGDVGAVCCMRRLVGTNLFHPERVGPWTPVWPVSSRRPLLVCAWRSSCA